MNSWLVHIRLSQWDSRKNQLSMSLINNSSTGKLPSFVLQCVHSFAGNTCLLYCHVRGKLSNLTPQTYGVWIFSLPIQVDVETPQHKNRRFKLLTQVASTPLLRPIFPPGSSLKKNTALSRKEVETFLLLRISLPYLNHPT